VEAEVLLSMQTQWLLWTRRALRMESDTPSRDTAWAMSQESVERVGQAYQLYKETQQPDYELLHRDVAWHTARDLPDSDTYRGHDGVAELYSEWIGSFEDFRVDVEEMIDGSGDTVVVITRLRGRFRGSSEEVNLIEAHVWKLLDGKAVEIREYRTKAEALEAAGLRE
jgi:ketosteroid isomerase-like protein